MFNSKRIAALEKRVLELEAAVNINHIEDREDRSPGLMAVVDPFMGIPGCWDIQPSRYQLVKIPVADAIEKILSHLGLELKVEKGTPERVVLQKPPKKGAK